MIIDLTGANALVLPPGFALDSGLPSVRFGPVAMFVNTDEEVFPWNVPAGISRTILWTDEVDSPDDSTWTFSPRASGADYTGVEIAPFSGTFIDNDTRGISIVADRMEGEEGEAFSFNVRLTSEPSADVTLRLVAESDHFVVTPSAFELDFTSGNWRVPQTVAVIVEGDDVDTGDGELNLLFTGAAGTSDYQLLPGGAISATVTVRDNDTRGFTLAGDGLPPQLSEAGGVNSAFYTVALGSEPTADVEVRLSLSGLRFYQAEAQPTEVTFTPANWRVPQRIDITVLDNDVDASPDNETETLVITYHVTGGDYDGLRVLIDEELLVTGDDDTRGLSIAAARTEGVEGETFIFNVKLTSEPTADVTFMLTAAVENFVLVQSVFPLDFTPMNWDDLQTVAVMVADDDLYSEPDVLTLALTDIVAGAGDYSLLPLPGGAATATVTVRDNEVAPVLSLTLSPFEASEGGRNANERLAVSLSALLTGAAPFKDTVFELTVGGPGDTALRGLDYSLSGLAFRPLRIAAGQTTRLLVASPFAAGSGPDRRGSFRGAEHRRQSGGCRGRAGRHRPGLGRLHDHRRRQRRHRRDELDGA